MDLDMLLRDLPLGTYVLDGGKPILVTTEEEEWVGGEMPFTLPLVSEKLAA